MCSQYLSVKLYAPETRSFQNEFHFHSIEQSKWLLEMTERICASNDFSEFFVYFSRFGVFIYVDSRGGLLVGSSTVEFNQTDCLLFQSLRRWTMSIRSEWIALSFTLTTAFVAMPILKSEMQKKNNFILLNIIFIYTHFPIYPIYMMNWMLGIVGAILLCVYTSFAVCFNWCIICKIIFMGFFSQYSELISLDFGMAHVYSISTCNKVRICCTDGLCRCKFCGILQLSSTNERMMNHSAMMCQGAMSSHCNGQRIKARVDWFHMWRTMLTQSIEPNRRRKHKKKFSKYRHLHSIFLEFCLWMNFSHTTDEKWNREHG